MYLGLKRSYRDLQLQTLVLRLLKGDKFTISRLTPYQYNQQPLCMQDTHEQTLLNME